MATCLTYCSHYISTLYTTPWNIYARLSGVTNALFCSAKKVACSSRKKVHPWGSGRKGVAVNMKMGGYIDRCIFSLLSGIALYPFGRYIFFSKRNISLMETNTQQFLRSEFPSQYFGAPDTGVLQCFNPLDVRRGP